MPLELVGKGVDVVSNSPTVYRGSQQVVTALFEPFSNPPRSDIG